MELKTITDFDFAVGGNINHFERISKSPSDVTKLDVDVLLWLMIEQEYRRPPRQTVLIDAGLRPNGRTQLDGGPWRPCRDTLIPNRISPDFLRRLDRETEQNARQYTEQSLRDAGIDGYGLLEELSPEYRSAMLLQLCKGSDLFPEGSNRFRTVPQIFNALRSRSKFDADFDMVQKLGEGKFGSVYQAIAKKEGNLECAIKMISVSFKSLREDVQMAINESNTLRVLKGHPNIVGLHQSWLELTPDASDGDSDSVDNSYDKDDEDYAEVSGVLKFYIQLDLCSETLSAWKNGMHERKEVLDETLILKISKEIFEGLAYIHSHNILHLDINPNNIVWANPQYTHVRIVDFGLAMYGTECNVKRGTLGYAAPDLTLTTKSDVFSAAVTIIELTVYTKTELSNILKKKEPGITNSILNELLIASLNENFIERPSAEEVKTKLSMYNNAQN